MITLTPAYGRDYKSKKAAVDAFLAGQDFILNVPPFHSDARYNGKPVNLAQLQEKVVKLRYDQLRKVTLVNLGGLR